MAQVNLEDNLTIDNFRAAVRNIDLTDKHHSIYITKKGEVKCQGRIGTFFTFRSTFQRTTNLLFDEMKKSYGINGAALGSWFIGENPTRGKPLKAAMVKKLLESFRGLNNIYIQVPAPEHNTQTEAPLSSNQQVKERSSSIEQGIQKQNAMDPQSTTSQPDENNAPITQDETTQNINKKTPNTSVVENTKQEDSHNINNDIRGKSKNDFKTIREMFNQKMFNKENPIITTASEISNTKATENKTVGNTPLPAQSEKHRPLPNTPTQSNAQSIQPQPDETPVGTPPITNQAPETTEKKAPKAPSIPPPSINIKASKTTRAREAFLGQIESFDRSRLKSSENSINKDEKPYEKDDSIRNLLKTALANRRKGMGYSDDKTSNIVETKTTETNPMKTPDNVITQDSMKSVTDEIPPTTITTPTGIKAPETTVERIKPPQTLFSQIKAFQKSNLKKTTTNESSPQSENDSIIKSLSGIIDTRKPLDNDENDNENEDSGDWDD